jgi:hypothetical protein
VSENRQRQLKITVRFSREEFDIIEKKAKQAGLTRASYLRESALFKKVIAPNLSREEKKFIVRQLSGMGNNLNQLTKLAHERKISYPGILVGLDELKVVVQELWQSLKSATQSKQGD